LILLGLFVEIEIFTGTLVLYLPGACSRKWLIMSWLFAVYSLTAGKSRFFWGGRQAIDPLSSVVSDGCGSWAPPNAALNVGIFSKKQGKTPGCEGGQR
jgi:hypothetical protein